MKGKKTGLVTVRKQAGKPQKPAETPLEDDQVEIIRRAFMDIIRTPPDEIPGEKKIDAILKREDPNGSDSSDAIIMLGLFGAIIGLILWGMVPVDYMKPIGLWIAIISGAGIGIGLVTSKLITAQLMLHGDAWKSLFTCRRKMKCLQTLLARPPQRVFYSQATIDELEREAKDEKVLSILQGWREAARTLNERNPVIPLYGYKILTEGGVVKPECWNGRGMFYMLTIGAELGEFLEFDNAKVSIFTDTVEAPVTFMHVDIKCVLDLERPASEKRDLQERIGLRTWDRKIPVLFTLLVAGQGRLASRYNLDREAVFLMLQPLFSSLIRVIYERNIIQTERDSLVEENTSWKDKYNEFGNRIYNRVEAERGDSENTFIVNKTEIKGYQKPANIASLVTVAVIVAIALTFIILRQVL